MFTQPTCNYDTHAHVHELDRKLPIRAYLAGCYVGYDIQCFAMAAAMKGDHTIIMALWSLLKGWPQD